ncbi:MAG: 30S ribosomal protein S8e [Candidatus Woesearchaeota archaeon]|jgi:small subunit ribosomal protein S8e
MVIIQSRPNRKPTGGRYNKRLIIKKKCYLGRSPSLIKLEEVHVKRIRTLGGNQKMRMLSADIMNVVDPKTKTPKKVKITSILENPANRHYVRRNIITKGTIVQTEAGKAKITNRPGQEGTINGVLI